MKISENIKKYRKKANLTQIDLALKLDKTLRTIQKYESGEITPSIKILEDIAKVLNVSIENIISGEVEPIIVKASESEKMTVEQSTYRANLIEKLDKQIQKGIDKYGTTLEQNTWFTAMDRLTYLQEELIDGLVYIEHIMAKLKELNIELD